MDFTKASHAFQEYLKDYDQNNDKVRLKIVHTYGVVKQAEEVCRRRNLDQETTSLAKIIALLHDIGRFEQLKRFDSFDPATMDHAAYGMKSFALPLQNTVILFWKEFLIPVRFSMPGLSATQINWTTSG